jgi:hypothetical protein
LDATAIPAFVAQPGITFFEINNCHPATAASAAAAGWHKTMLIIGNCYR